MIMKRIALLGSLALAACSPHVLVDYPTGSGVAKTRCGGAYQIADDPKGGRMLVSAYQGSAVASVFCRREAERLAGSVETGLPFQTGAEAWLISQGKTRCRITSGRIVGVSHAEFFYACPG